jgi:hypothetical protein
MSGKRKQSLRHALIQDRLDRVKAIQAERRQPIMEAIDLTEFVNLEGIPILETGIEYPASNGYFTFGVNHLEEIVKSQEDPHVVAPRIKIGHADNPINDDLQELYESINKNAETPSLGTIQNMRTVNDGHTLIGDFYGLPAWLAAILETAYPARSIEGGAWKNPANEKQYDMCLMAVALLGVAGPGCTSLADLQELFSEEGPKVSVIEMPAPKMEGGSHVPRIQLQVNVEDIRRAFYDDFAQGDRYWWWDRELLIDPNEFIVQDPDEGQLYRLSFDIAEGGEGPEAITFGDPKPVKIKYVPDKSAKPTEGAEASRTCASQLERTGVLLAVNTTPPRLSERERNDKKETKMGLSVDAINKLRESKGLTPEQLPDDATDEQVQSAILADDTTPGIDQPSNNASPDAPESGTDASGAITAPDSEADRGTTGPVAAGLPAGMVAIPQETLEALQKGAQMAVSLHETTVKNDREAFVKAAVASGKIPPSARDGYIAQMNLGGEIEKGVRAFLESAPSVLPVGPEIGSEGDPTPGADSAAYPDNHLTPEERQRVLASRGEAEAPKTRIYTEV